MHDVYSERGEKIATDGDEKQVIYLHVLTNFSSPDSDRLVCHAIYGPPVIVPGGPSMAPYMVLARVSSRRIILK